MRRIIRVLSIIIIIIFAQSLTGCWNYVEIDRLYMVSGFAVDKGTNGKYLLTVEIVDIELGGKVTKFTSKVFTAEGDTLFDAVRNIINISGKRLYWSHAKVVIISQDIAREGMIQILDWIARDTEPRMEIRILISKESTANEIFSINKEKKIQSLELDQMLSSQNSVSKAPDIKVYQLINTLSEEKQSEILPAVGLTADGGEKTVTLSGSAILKKDKLVGFLGEEETKYVLFIKDKIKGGILPEMESGENSRHSISLEVFKNKTKIVPEYSNGELAVNIDIKTNVSVDEHGYTGNHINPQNRSMLKVEAQKSLEKNIENVIVKVQDQYSTDIFGFGTAVKIKMPYIWKSIYHDWDSLFADLKVNVTSTIDIRDTGLISKPIKAGE